MKASDYVWFVAAMAFVVLFTFWPRLVRWCRGSRCRHEWRLEGGSIARPLPIDSIKVGYGMERQAARMMFGSMTHVYRCETCNQIKTVETIGTPGEP